MRSFRSPGERRTLAQSTATRGSRPRTQRVFVCAQCMGHDSWRLSCLLFLVLLVLILQSFAQFTELYPQCHLTNSLSDARFALSIRHKSRESKCPVSAVSNDSNDKSDDSWQDTCDQQSMQWLSPFRVIAKHQESSDKKFAVISCVWPPQAWIMRITLCFTTLAWLGLSYFSLRRMDSKTLCWTCSCCCSKRGSPANAENAGGKSHNALSDNCLSDYCFDCCVSSDEGDSELYRANWIRVYSICQFLAAVLCAAQFSLFVLACDDVRTGFGLCNADFRIDGSPVLELEDGWKFKECRLDPYIYLCFCDFILFSMCLWTYISMKYFDSDGYSEFATHDNTARTSVRSGRASRALQKHDQLNVRYEVDNDSSESSLHLSDSNSSGNRTKRSGMKRASDGDVFGGEIRSPQTMEEPDHWNTNQSNQGETDFRGSGPAAW